MVYPKQSCSIPSKCIRVISMHTRGDMCLCTEQVSQLTCDGYPCTNLALLLQWVTKRRTTQRKKKAALKKELAQLTGGQDAASEGSVVSQDLDAVQESASEKDFAVNLPAPCCCCCFSHPAAPATLSQRLLLTDVSSHICTLLSCPIACVSHQGLWARSCRVS